MKTTCSFSTFLGIAESILASLQPESDAVWGNDMCLRNDNVIDPYDDVMESYYKDLNALCKNRYGDVLTFQYLTMCLLVKKNYSGRCSPPQILFAIHN